ncbi:MAG: CoA ester lyase [Candidatus Competibacteraceae bacterium]|uniref:Lyase/thioesterase n=1 Tax=Candidatus Contendobacter odensis Run_B_J11 TaxID=1400861 RepID=A0A7U7J2M9_9GAMM|nr:CoA ester lyase [Candidatus Contendobacter odensis]MBK8536816.1 CoA ester lyase [Candidatus Competibacteraceae bacterium]MBK8751091.1 CoA ester lyase [Candidatus Competibacteraceae bacterium]CDH43344.1 putative lyase/thioesterase [Candidatus Contendobacter odensis Run_B_J11]
MSKPVRPRRSVLYMPGSNARALDKARNLPADGYILDLEDAVAPDSKEIARQQVCDAVKAGGFGQREIIIRVNALSTKWGYDDIAAASKSGANALLLPKVESADAIRHMEAIMRANDAPETMTIWAMMETPRSVLESQRIAESTPRMECLVMGTSDLAKELDCAHTHERLPFLASLGLCLLAARAAGLSILDGVYLDLNDEAGFEFACRQGQEFGFDGKTLIHPKQVAPCNRVFTPKSTDVEWSRRIIEAHTAAAARGEGVAVVEGKLIENLHVESARRLVTLADAIAALDAANAAV